LIRMCGPFRVMVHAVLPVAFLLLLSGCMTVAEKERIEALPMYGQPQQQRPEFLVWEHNTFVSQETQRYAGDRRRASQAWVARGMQALGFADTDSAMRQFNRAWLLDKDNYQVYWGFAQVLVARGEPEPALPHLKKALSLMDDLYQKPALLSDLGTVYSLLGERADGARSIGLFTQANAYFSRAVELDGRFAPAWYHWVQSLYREGNYPAAREKIRLARQQGVEQFPRDLSVRPEASLD